MEHQIMEDFFLRMERAELNFEPLIDRLVKGHGFYPLWPIYGLTPKTRDQIYFIETEKILNTLFSVSQYKYSRTIQIIPLSFCGSETNSPQFMEFFRDFRKNLGTQPQILEKIYRMLSKNQSDVVLVPLGFTVYEMSAAEFTDILAGLLFGGMSNYYEPNNQYVSFWH